MLSKNKIFIKDENVKIELIGHYKFKLLEDIQINIGSNLITKVPTGYITDGYTIPRIFWNIFPPVGKDDKSAILHSYLYSRAIFKRKFCDEIFLESMKQNHVNRWVAYTKYFFVRIFGHSYYNKAK